MQKRNGSTVSHGIPSGLIIMMSFLRLRPIGLALRVLRLRPIGLALRVLRVRPIGLAVRAYEYFATPRVRNRLRFKACSLQQPQPGFAMKYSKNVSIVNDP